MDKIDLSDKFLHSIMGTGAEFDIKITVLEEILDKGYLLSQHDINPELNDKRIILSVHPNSIYDDIYYRTSMDFKDEEPDFADDEFFCYCTDAYYDTVYSFFLILSNKIKENFNIRITCDSCHELAVTDKIELDKYLLGIGNAGLFIPSNFLSCYYLCKYLNGEINLDNFLSIGKEINYSIPASRFVDRLNCEVTNDHTLDYFINSDPNEFIRDKKRSYYILKEILNKYSKNIPLCDRFGYILDYESQLKKVIEMQKYIKKTKNNNLISKDNVKRLYLDTKKYYGKK